MFTTKRSPPDSLAIAVAVVIAIAITISHRS
jgi:hypothetical protein